jgi:hypothetical protein
MKLLINMNLSPVRQRFADNIRFKAYYRSMNSLPRRALPDP